MDLWVWCLLLVCGVALYALLQRPRQTIENAQPKIIEPIGFGADVNPQYVISYADADGIVTEREVHVFSASQAKGVISYNCWCFLRGDQRTFRSDRILSIHSIATGREVSAMRRR